jgi:hypothetical protein
MIYQETKAGSGQVLKSDPVKIFKNTFSLECVAHFRVPLETIDMLTGQRNRLCTTDG